MTDRVVPLLDARAVRRPPKIPVDLAHAASLLRDRLHRPLLDLRISVTDRCNFRCVYCMPKELFDNEHCYVPHNELLTFEEITRLARIFVGRGTRKIRLTGGEPLLRRDLESLVRMLARVGVELDAPLDLALTTNGSILARKATSLAEAGLRRVTVSLDALDDAIFRRMSDVDFPVARVLEGIDAAAAAGFAPVKINMVVKRGYNEDQVLPMARYFRERGHVLRFIEFMDVGNSNDWRLDDVIASDQILAQINAHMPIEPVESTEPGVVAQRWRYRDGSGEIGTISSVTRAFCGDCTRARLSTEGCLYLCLFSQRGHDLRALLRGGADDLQIAAAIGAVWAAREDRYSELRAQETMRPGKRIEMSYIGG
ncbi:MAG TPA: GTP 3',8-cyclase MoaA [Burkholderiaceae bacterium]|nr:GTP 3',8-cyclase MoaA [Burkholderiaceae bacterium]